MGESRRRFLRENPEILHSGRWRFIALPEQVTVFKVLVTMTIRSAITGQFKKVAEEHGRALAALNDDMPLLDSGLDSLCFAVVVTRLEDSLGVDPFAAEGVLFPITFGDFVRLYEASAR